MMALITNGLAMAIFTNRSPEKISENKLYPPLCRNAKIACVQMLPNAEMIPLKFAHNKLDRSLFLETLSTTAMPKLAAQEMAEKTTIVVIATGSNMLTFVLETADSVRNNGIKAKTMTPMIAVEVSFSPNFFTATYTSSR